MTVETADVVVIGLGAVGSATLHRLALAGARVVGIDRFHPPHDRGSSHGESRITRLAVGEGSDYAPLVRRSHDIWRELEAQSGESLFLQIGGLIMGPRDGAALHHGKDDFVRRTIRVAQENAIAHEVLDATAIAARFPQFGLRGDELACYEPSAGLVFPERCIDVQLRMARARGAITHLGEIVTAIRSVGDGVDIVTDRRTVNAARAVVTAGPWVGGLMGGAVADHARVYRQALHWFAAERAEDYAPDRFPIFIWMHGAGTEDYLYGFPALPGTGAVKVATEQYAKSVDPDSVDREVSDAETRAMFERHVAGRLRGVRPDRLRAAACMYTVTPDSGFIVDRLAMQPNVVVASACSGHGFKHSAGLGEVLARRALGAAAGTDAFAIDRFAPA